ncbi:hypothetical protein ILUMI_06479 [Ignelater luminosus]|uniref:Uncharacterized protein n=1 Tax=Ignelater luminosus TaxID=2038154 RepID=A0A8K0D5N4_IGNLU|nr:hypothetical protein ILUMI_06479 [Ignelater luminosus]
MGSNREYVRKDILRMYSENDSLSYFLIAQQANCTRWTVKKMREGFSVKDKPRSGRPEDPSDVKLEKKITWRGTERHRFANPNYSFVTLSNNREITASNKQLAPKERNETEVDEDYELNNENEQSLPRSFNAETSSKEFQLLVGDIDNLEVESSSLDTPNISTIPLRCSTRTRHLPSRL